MAKQVLSASDFLAGIQRKECDYEIEGVGTVRVRSLSVSQATTIMEKYKDNVQESVYEVIALGLAEPQLDEAQVEMLRDAAPMPVMALFERIMEMSAMATNAEAAERTENLAGDGSSV